MRLLLLPFLLLVIYSANSQSIWIPIPENEIPLIGERRIIPKQYTTVRLNESELHPILDAAPLQFSLAAQNSTLTLTLPMPDGRAERFLLTESPVMAPALQALFPEIRTYTGIGIDDPSALLKCDFTIFGFHAMIISSKHSTVFIDPYSFRDLENYIVYYKKDFATNKRMECGLEDGHLLPSDKLDPFQGAELTDCNFRKYRLALACTGEYAAFHGGTTTGAASAMTTTMNRVNGVYAIDFGVVLELVSNNNNLIYLNSGTDPYTNGDPGVMLGQNVTTCNGVIGSANYDIGHVFGTDSGGVAGLGVVCTGSKARGVTGSGSPSGDPFDIDYVAHEMGHQFGCSHTFYATTGSCGGGNISQTNAMEPGSGTTVMAYAGICGSTNNVQPNSDAYFHAQSLQQGYAFIVSGSGNTCDNITNTSNSIPTANAGSGYTIPKSTPFALTATGSDPNSNPITFCWEQVDNTAGGASPPASTNTVGPMFRSLTPTGSETRIFPELDDILSGANGNTWEVLPSVARTLNFRVIVRDNNPAYGCSAVSSMAVTVSSSGPFGVSAPNTGVTWAGNSAQTVTWTVNGTSGAPVSCANVKISLSTDGGQSFSYVLAASTPNDGSQSITLPNISSSQCRVKVECATGNIFFDISNTNFTINMVAPIELLNFELKKENDHDVLLQWSTASEQNNKGFEIEMLGGQHQVFTPIAFVAGKGNSQQLVSYSHKVADLDQGDYSFRLKQLDMDGHFEYSPLRSITVKALEKLKIQPNPAQNDLVLSLFSENEGSISFEILNQFGQIQYKQSSLEVQSGTNSIRLDISSLPNGVYYYRCHKEQQVFEGKLMIWR